MLGVAVISSRWALFLVTLLHTGSGHAPYRDKIPNGHNVPSPCKPGETWAGVGHKLMAGGGVRNTFGQDFADNGKEWTRALCEKDSDSDGLTNGQELGDPNCTWSQGMTNPTGSTLSHPGVCDPWNDPKCLARDESWVLTACQSSDFTCSSINDVNVRNMDLKIPRTSVPPVETTYMCQIFSIPNDTDYHIIASTPIIDNVNIMHHAVIFGCTEDEDESLAPFVCGMLPGGSCRALVSLWTLGNAGDCIHESVGFRMGVHGFKKLAVQLHWNNPEKRSDYFDQSGMKIYFTPVLRAYDAGILTTGQESLLIPPGEPSVKTMARTPGACTNRSFTGTIYVTEAANHMHYLGVSQSLELYRNGVKVRDLARDRKYNYDNPLTHKFSEPVEIRPGDELRTHCEFASSKKSTTTMFGDATSDEMCYSFITYYPQQKSNRPFFTNFKSIPKCMLDIEDTYEGCAWKTILSDPELLQLQVLVNTTCNLFEKCSPACYNAIQTTKQHKCFQGDIWKYNIYTLLRMKVTVTFLMKLRSCECEDVAPSSASPTAPDAVSKPDNSTCDWAGLYVPSVANPLDTIFINVTGSCAATGDCLQECVPAVRAAREHPCFQGAEWEHGRRYLYERSNSKTLEFLLDFESCNCELRIAATPPTTPATESDTKPTTGAVSFQYSYQHFVLLTIISVFSVLAS
ncbi:uncharacterized protein LOC124129019 [Haliotis rufescens]|uniref:uncharacterized protein LOC124129019 n=1 Tax=Haliotis rufescens TaxID=6454 RepID=UPI00201F16BB|nr:uncharacterized protein LOC124129019 [Haliotis rufescens]